jgi:hypothetical protein
MPTPTLVKQLAIARFQSFGIQLPAVQTGTATPVGMPGSPGAMLANRPSGLASSTSSAAASAAASRFVGAAGAGATQPSPQTATPMPLPPALFRAASNSRGDVDVQKAMHDGYMELIGGLTQAVSHAWGMWRLQAHFRDLRIMAVTATGIPGCLAGPSMQSLVRTAPAVAGWTGWKGGIRDGFSDGLDKAWDLWKRFVTVPGLPWYPAFAAFPGPMAPPMPNVPTPLVSCPSAQMVAMTVPSELARYLADNLKQKMDYHTQFAEAMAAMISPAFLQWLPTQMVMNVLGKGPIPSFAPPYVPVGPVVAGDVIPTPGHLSS